MRFGTLPTATPGFTWDDVIAQLAIPTIYNRDHPSVSYTSPDGTKWIVNYDASSAMPSGIFISSADNTLMVGYASPTIIVDSNGNYAYNPGEAMHPAQYNKETGAQSWIAFATGLALAAGPLIAAYAAGGIGATEATTSGWVSAEGGTGYAGGAAVDATNVATTTYNAAADSQAYNASAGIGPGDYTYGVDVTPSVQTPPASQTTPYNAAADSQAYNASAGIGPGDYTYGVDVTPSVQTPPASQTTPYNAAADSQAFNASAGIGPGQYTYGVDALSSALPGSTASSFLPTTAAGAVGTAASAAGLVQALTTRADNAAASSLPLPGVNNLTNGAAGVNSATGPEIIPGVSNLVLIAVGGGLLGLLLLKGKKNVR